MFYASKGTLLEFYQLVILCVAAAHLQILKFHAKLKSHRTNCLKPFLYSTRSIDAVLLGGSGGLRGKYITTQIKHSAAIPKSEM